MEKNLRVAFFGTPDRALWCLDQMKAAGVLPVVVITAPDKPKGRGLILSPSDVKVWAEQNSIPVLTPTTLKDTEFEKAYTAYSPDIALVLAYGKIIPENILEIPKYKTLNIHGSLLPKLRGASPIETTILNSETPGVTLMLMDKEMDHGPILAMKELSFSHIPHAVELAKTVIQAGTELFLSSVSSWISNKLVPIEQDHTKATYTQKISKDMGEIDINTLDEHTWRKYQALTPWPGLYFFVTHQNTKKRVIVKEAHFDGVFHIDTVVVEGKKPQTFTSFKDTYLQR